MSPNPFEWPTSPCQRRWMFLLFLFVRGRAGDAAALETLPAFPPPGQPLVGPVTAREDLARPPSVFETKGTLWEGGKLRLSGPAAAIKRTEARQVAELRFTIEFLNEFDSPKPRQAVVQMITDRGVGSIVAIQEEPTTNGPLRSISILHRQTEPTGPAKLVRVRAVKSDRSLDGPWRVRLEWGVTRVFHGWEQVLIGYVPAGWEPIREAGISIPLGAALLSALEFSAHAPFAALSDESKAKRAEAEAKTAEAARLAEQGKGQERVAALTAARELFAVALGEEHPRTNVADHDLGTALVDVSRFREAEQSLRGTLERRRSILGPEHLHSAQTMTNLASSLVGLNHHAEAQGLLEDGLRIRVNLLGAAHPLSIDSALRIANCEFALGRLEEARKKATALVEPIRSSQGDPSEGLGSVLWLVGSIARAQGQRDAAREYIGAAVTIFRKLSPKSDLFLASCLLDQAANRLVQGELDNARRDTNDALAIFRREQGPYGLGTGHALARLGEVEQRAGNAEAADGAQREALRILSLYGDKQASLGWHLAGVLCAEWGRYDRARRSLQLAQTRLEKLPTHSPLDEGLIACDLAWVLAETGEYDEGIKTARRAIELLAGCIGAEDPRVGRARGILGRALVGAGDLAQGRSELEKAVAILGRDWRIAEEPPEAFEVDLARAEVLAGDKAAAQTRIERLLEKPVNDSRPLRRARLRARQELGMMLLRAGHRQEASGLFLAAHEEAGKLYGFSHPLALDPVDQLAQLGSLGQDQGKEMALLEQVLAERERSHGPDHPAVALALDNLARAFFKGGRLSEAQSATARALAIHRARGVAGEEDVVRELRRVALVDFLAGGMTNARVHLAEAHQIQLRRANRALDELSDIDAVGYIESGAVDPSILCSVLRAIPGITPEEMYAPVWATRALASQVNRQRRRLALEDPEGKRLHGELIRTEQELASAMIEHPVGAERVPRVQALAARKESLQRELGLIVAKRRTDQETSADDLQPIDLARRLPADTAIVDFAALTVWPAKSNGQLKPRLEYDAFILRSTPAAGAGSGPAAPSVSWVSLGSAEEIDALVVLWRHQLVSPFMKKEAMNAQDPWGEPASLVARGLRQLLWGKLEPKLAGCRVVIVVPTGALAQVPWCALPGRVPGSYLIEDYAIGAAHYPRQILDLLAEPPPANRHSLFVTTFPDMPLLAGGAADGKKSGSIQNGSIFLEAEQATETNVRYYLGMARVAHLESHGFVNLAREGDYMATLTPIEDLFLAGFGERGRRGVAQRNPLTRTGIVLKPNLEPVSRQKASAAERDGILTGEEIAGMDLGNTELVVVDACETGLGDIAAGEGVFSVQRAFEMAGARSVVGTLWIVLITPCRIMMRDFYDNLYKQRLGKLESLRQAQLKMLRDPKILSQTFDRFHWGDGRPRPRDSTRSPPALWAPFLLTGDWR